VLNLQKDPFLCDFCQNFPLQSFNMSSIIVDKDKRTLVAVNAAGIGVLSLFREFENLSRASQVWKVWLGEEIQRKRASKKYLVLIFHDSEAPVNIMTTMANLVRGTDIYLFNVNGSSLILFGVFFSFIIQPTGFQLNI
jgi:hypothetical protein